MDAPVEREDEECVLETEVLKEGEEALPAPLPIELDGLAKLEEEVEEDCVDAGRDEEGEGFGTDCEEEEE